MPMNIWLRIGKAAEACGQEEEEVINPMEIKGIRIFLRIGGGFGATVT